MNFQINGNGIEVTEAIRNYIDSRVQKVLRHNDNIVNLSFTLSTDKSRLNHTVEANVQVPGKNLHVEHTESEMYAAIDKLMDKLDLTLIKRKEKQNDTRTRADAPNAPKDENR